MARSTFDLILNSRARHLAPGSPLRASILDAARGMQVHETRSPGELAEVATWLAAHATRGVVLAGGDGSHMAGLSALRAAFGTALPDIALCPGGTVNTVARNWGFSGSTHVYVQRLLTAVAAGRARRRTRPALHLRDSTGLERTGFIFGAGLVSNFFALYEASKHQGYAGAARIVARVFAGSFVGAETARRVLTPTPCVLHVDGVEQQPRAWSLIAASVVHNLGLGMKLTYRAGEEFDRIHAVASPLAPHALGPQLPLVLSGLPLRGRSNVDARVRELALRFSHQTNAYVLDGELCWANAVSVAPGPTFHQLFV